MSGFLLANEGETCDLCAQGTYVWEQVDNCSCHISPPCTPCVNAEIICNSCGYAPWSNDISDDDEVNAEKARTDKIWEAVQAAAKGL